ncbi:MAG: SprT-like domain-containing protein [Armatimonadetes bacterium]|nr:SprT-like domain-containing protein [Armatimonadota bacterium]
MFFKGLVGAKVHQPALPFDKEPGVDIDACVHSTLAEAAAIFPLKREVVVRWRNYPVTAGRAYLRESAICLSANLLTTPERARETLLHEYAHLVVFERFGRKARPHGPEWRAAMQALGLAASVTHSYNCVRRPMPKPYAVRCEACGVRLPRSRPLKGGRLYKHIGCGGRIRMERTP